MNAIFIYIEKLYPTFLPTIEGDPSFVSYIRTYFLRFAIRFGLAVLSFGFFIAKKLAKRKSPPIQVPRVVGFQLNTLGNQPVFSLNPNVILGACAIMAPLQVLQGLL